MKVKRLISIFVAVALLASVVIFPVSADVDSDLSDGKLLNLLDYGNSLESENNYQSYYGDVDFNFNMPSPSYVSYIDAVIYYSSSSSNPLKSVNLRRNGSILSRLDIISLGNGYYRLFANTIPVNRTFSTLGLQFLSTDESVVSYTSVLSLNIGLYGNSTSDLSGNCVVTYEDGTKTATHKPSSNAQITWTCNADYDEAGYGIDLSTSDFYKYDYVDFLFLVYADTIDSLAVNTYLTGSSVPYEVSFIDSSLTDASTYYVQVRMDLTNINRSNVDDYPLIVVMGVSHYPDILNAVIVSSIVGHVKYEYENPVIFWFKKTFSAIGDGFSNIGSKLTSGFNSVVNAITGNSAAADQAGEEMKGAADELNNMGNAFDQVETPDIDIGGLSDQFVNFSPSGLTVLATITNNSYVSALLVLVFTFALCAYVLFGKR